MRRARRRLWPWLALTALAVLALAMWFPARWAWPWLARRVPLLELSGLHGTVWSGGADAMRWNGYALGALRWRIDRRSLLGHAAGWLALDAPRWSGQARWRRSGAQAFTVSDARGWIDAGLVQAAFLRGLRPEGRFVVNVPTLRVRGGWPVVLNADVRWRQARLRGADGAVALGEQRLRLHDQAGTTLVGTLDSVGDTPLRSRGMLHVSPLAWRAQLTLRAADAGNTALRRMLARLGRPAPDGSLQLAWHGGLLSGG